RPMVDEIHRTENDRTATDVRATLGRSSGGTLSKPPRYTVQGLPPRIKLGVPKISKTKNPKAPRIRFTIVGYRSVPVHKNTARASRGAALRLRSNGRGEYIRTDAPTTAASLANTGYSFPLWSYVEALAAALEIRSA